MSALTHILKSLIHPSPISSGQISPVVSLTAHDGTWVRSPDRIEREAQIYLFFPDTTSASVRDMLRDLNDQISSLSEEEQDRFSLFGVTSQSLEQLRKLADEINLDYLLLYDPFAIEARRFGFSGRRPYCRLGHFVIDKKGMLVHSEYGPPDITSLLNLLSISTPKQAASNDEAQPQELSVHLISSDDAVGRLKEGYKIVDVRTRSEFEADHIPGSIHIPLDELSQKYISLDPMRELLFVCQTGGRARSAAEFISSIGGQLIYVVQGGMSEWNGPRKTGGVLS